MNAPASGESNALSSGSPGGVKSTSEQNVVAPQKKVSGPPKVPVSPEEENKPVVQHVLEQIDRGTRRILGMPPDVAIIVGILVVIIVVVALRFIL